MQLKGALRRASPHHKFLQCAPSARGVELECFKLRSIYHRRAHIQGFAASGDHCKTHLLPGFVQRRLAICVLQRRIGSAIQPAEPLHPWASSNGLPHGVSEHAAVHSARWECKGARRTAVARWQRGRRRQRDEGPSLCWTLSVC